MKEKVEVYNLIDTDLNEIVMTGGIEDVRIYLKNQWKLGLINLIKKVLEIEIEEDYYAFVDNNINVVLTSLGYIIKEVCQIPIEDFELPIEKFMKDANEVITINIKGSGTKKEVHDNLMRLVNTLFELEKVDFEENDEFEDANLIMKVELGDSYS